MLALPLNYAVAADEWPGFEVRLGGYITDFDSELRINSSADLRGSDTNLEDELDMDDGLEEVRIDLRWRFLPRHAIDFAYYDISREGRRVLERQLDIGDQTFVVGTNLKSKLDFEVYKLAYAYSFAHSDKTDAALSLGLHVIDVGFKADGTVLGIPVERHSSDVTLPLPVVGIQFARRLGGPFMLSLDVDLFAIEYGDYKGSLWDANLTLDVAFTDRVGGFVGYNFVDMNVESEDTSLLGELDYQYGAVTAGIRLTF